VCMTLSQLITLEICAERYTEALLRYHQLIEYWRRLEKNHDAASLQPATVVKLLESDLPVVQLAAQRDLGKPEAAQSTEGDLRAGLLALASVHLAGRGQHEAAARLAEEVVQIAPGTRRIYIVARCYALCAAAVQRADTHGDAQMQSLRDRYVNQALHHLAAHLKRFPVNPSMVAVHPDWNSIRKNPNFNKAVWSTR
jgi:hypothetical protein